MKSLLDIVPLVAFFAAYKIYDIYIATAVLMGAIALQMAIHWIQHKQLEKFQIITLVVVLIFGGLTVGLRNPLFIMWKPTLVSWLFASALWIGQRFSQEPLGRKLLGEKIELPDHVWRSLTRMWIGFFVFLGSINIVVFKMFEESIWVNKF